MLVRLGQQSESGTNAFVNSTPFWISSEFTVGIAESVSQRWSSVRIITTLGCPAARATAGPATAIDAAIAVASRIRTGRAVPGNAMQTPFGNRAAWRAAR